jgi:hypothetical protein
MRTFLDRLLFILALPLILVLFLTGALWFVGFVALCLLAGAIGWIFSFPANVGISRKRKVANKRFS